MGQSEFLKFNFGGKPDLKMPVALTMRLITKPYPEVYGF
jgi:hypothetical protein